MKATQFLLVTVLLLTSFASARATDDKYSEAMLKAIKSLSDSQDLAGYQQAVNTFERIAGSEKSRWEPFYYIGFGYIMMANLETDGVKKDAYLDKALESIEKGKALVPQESELVALEGFAYMIKVTVDPQSRGMVFAPRAMQTFEKAIQLNPENPRAIALKAQMEFGTAKFFSSPATEACATNAKALEKFDSYKSENALAPVWGKPMALSLTESCK